MTKSAGRPCGCLPVETCHWCRKASKEALDHKGLEPLYPAYSMAIAWNINAHDATEAALPPFNTPGMPIDGDALARSSAARRRNDEAWAQLHADAVELLRANHLDIDRPNL